MAVARPHAEPNALGMTRRLLLGLVLPLATVAQQPSNSAAALAAGREFTARLQLSQETDEKLFRAVGFERSQALLMAVLSQGQEKGASADDWKNLHRAADGLVELAIGKGELLRASVL